MRTAISRGMLGIALSMVAVAGACGYDPNFASGTLMCGPADSCPEGYECVSPFCKKKGGGCTAGTTAAGNLIGTWTFVAPSRRLINCSDGFSDDDTAWMDFFEITAGVTAPLETFYYCPFDLDINTSGQTVLRPAAPCSAPDTMDPTVTYTWTGQTFTLTTSDGCNGTLAASVPFVGSTVAAGTLYTCSMDFTGTVTKN